MRACNSWIWLGILLALCCFSDVAGLPVSEFYPFGLAEGDQLLNRSDEDSSSVIELEVPFVLFGTARSSVFVSHVVVLQGLIVVYRFVKYYKLQRCISFGV